MNLKISQETNDRKYYLHVVGEIDAYTAPQLREELMPLTEKKGIEIIVDLSEARYIDSTGLGIFIGALKSTYQNQSYILLTGLSNRLQRLFQITGLDEIIDIEEKREEVQ